MRKILVYISVIVVLYTMPSVILAAAMYPNRRPTVFVGTRALVTPTVARPVRRPVVKKQTVLQKTWNTIGPGILGSTGVLAGSAVAWYTLRKKTKAFDTYYQQIFQAQQRYAQDVGSENIPQSQAKANFKKALILIQEDAELTAARKKLDQEQLTAIVNKVNRMLEETIS